MDDIEDNSKLRRGIPVAHSIYGIPHTLNTANYVYILALEKCRNLGNLEALDVFIDELLNLHRGQGQDILWRDTLTCPTEEQYIKMVKDKTGGLFRLAVGLMKAFNNGCKLDFNPLLNKLAIYFQIRDDYMNLVSKDYHDHKSFCEDLTEGKFSFPIIWHQSKTHDNRLLNILKQRTEDVDVKHAVEYLYKIGSMKYTYDKVVTLKTEIYEIIEGLGGHDIESFSFIIT